MEKAHHTRRKDACRVAGAAQGTVSQDCFVFDVVKIKNAGILPE